MNERAGVGPGCSEILKFRNWASHATCATLGDQEGAEHEVKSLNHGNDQPSPRRSERSAAEIAIWLGLCHVEMDWARAIICEENCI